MDQFVRKARLEEDNRECQLSEMFGIAHLSGVPCAKEMEVHHKTYDRYGKEKPEDLISVCRRCHDFITSYVRGLRYSRRSETTIEDNVKTGLPVKAIRKYDGKAEFPVDGHQPADRAQWPACRPIKRVGEKAKKGEFSA